MEPRSGGMGKPGAEVPGQGEESASPVGTAHTSDSDSASLFHRLLLISLKRIPSPNRLD